MQQSGWRALFLVPQTAMENCKLNCLQLFGICECAGVSPQEWRKAGGGVFCALHGRGAWPTLPGERSQLKSILQCRCHASSFLGWPGRRDIGQSRMLYHLEEWASYRWRLEGGRLGAGVMSPFASPLGVVLVLVD